MNTTFKKVLTILIFTAALLVGGGYYVATHYYGITPYRPSDKPVLTEILQTDWYWLVSEDSYDFSPEYMFAHRAAVPSYPDNSLHIYVYRVQGKPAGFVTYYRESGCKGKVQFLAVAREHRKKGYAYKLLSFALEDALKHGICTIELVTRTTNHSAQRVYRKLGFKQTWEAEGFVAFEKSLM
jgi:ribosomal protein S18 acetylase RimI-like enzyme